MPPAKKRIPEKVVNLPFMMRMTQLIYTNSTDTAGMNDLCTPMLLRMFSENMSCRKATNMKIMYCMFTNLLLCTSYKHIQSFKWQQSCYVAIKLPESIDKAKVFNNANDLKKSFYADCLRSLCDYFTTSNPTITQRSYDWHVIRNHFFRKHVTGMDSGSILIY